MAGIPFLRHKIWREIAPLTHPLSSFLSLKSQLSRRLSRFCNFTLPSLPCLSSKSDCERDMVGLPYDCLVNPLGAVRFSFEKAISSGLDPSTSDGKDWGAVDLFNQFLFENGGLSQVPILNHSTIKYLQPNTLVRYRGMIQDMLGNEFYVGAYKDGSAWRTNKFNNCSAPVDFSPDMKLWERQLLYSVPVPGLNSWTEPLEDVNSHSREGDLKRLEKRQRETDEAADHMEVQDEELQVSPCVKKMRESEHATSSGMQKDTAVGGNCTGISWTPDTDRNSLPCVINVYDSSDSCFKLNEVFEFIGVLSFDPQSFFNKEDPEELPSDICEDELVTLPSIKVPQVHCLVHRKLGVQDFLSSFSIKEPTSSLIRGIREGLLCHFTTVLGNDGLAAQFLLLHLLSRVHARVDSVAVGKLSLNLTSFSKESAAIFGGCISLALNNLLPFTHFVPLTVEYLNTASLGAKKDYQTNRLTSGVLQLAEGTHLTFDETKLQTGTLNSAGVDNARLLNKLMDSQQVEYDFQYYKMDMSTDVQLLVLSEGKSNILPADVVLPFHPSSAGIVDTMGSSEGLQAWRWYLATLRYLPHSMSPEMQKVVEEDLVAARQSDRSLGTQEFSRLLTMGRLISLSFGETSLSLEHWQMAKELERLMKERLK